MDKSRIVQIGRRIFAVLLLLISGYQLWLVVDRWIAAIRYRIHFGIGSEPWVSLGFDTVIEGFASLLIVCILSLWVRRKARKCNDVFSQWTATGALGLGAIATAALIALLILPISELR
jgi:hypothetical protein